MDMKIHSLPDAAGCCCCLDTSINAAIW